MGDVFTSLRFRGITKESNSTYEAYINSFYKIFQITASMMSKEDLELLAKIEEAFQDDITLNVKNSGHFLYLFEEYLHALKKAGVYDPMVIKQFSSPYAKWQESV